MPGIFSSLRASLRTILLGVQGLPAARAWEGRKFTPTVGVPWVRETLVPNGSVLAAYGAGGLIREDITYLIDVFQPATDADRIFDLDDLGDAICRAFKPGTPLTTPDCRGQVISASRARIQHEPDWRMLPITVAGFVYRENA